MCNDFCQCVPVEPICGDGVVQWKLGEECEVGVGNGCGPYGECVDCLCVADPPCGNGVIDWKLGETCDPPGSICGAGGKPAWQCTEQCRCVRCLESGKPYSFEMDLKCCSSRIGILEDGTYICIDTIEDLGENACYFYVYAGLEVYAEHDAADNLQYYCYNGIAIPIEYRDTGFIVKECLGRVTDSSITMNLVPYMAGITAKAEYGTDPGTYTSHTSEFTNADIREPVEIVIDGLNPSTRYYYRVLVKKPGETEFSPRDEGSFHTKRDLGEPFTFAVTSDIHYPQIKDRYAEISTVESVLQNIKNDNPDFHIDLGDSFNTDYGRLRNDPLDIHSQEEGYKRYEELRYHLDQLHPATPFFFVIGNHEGELGYYPPGHQLPVWSEVARKTYVPNPDSRTYPQGGSDDENYYAFSWGDALFIMLDPNKYTETYGAWTLGTDQLPWAKALLENPDEEYIFIFIHRLSGGCDSYARGGAQCADRGEWGTEIHPMLFDLVSEGKEVIVFHGHDHAFADESRDNVRYILVPAPNTYVVEWAYYREFYDEGDLMHNPGYLFVSVDDTHALVEYRDENGNRKYPQ
jgi:hypothetical protein